jgi:hypothetical protein
MEQSRFAKWRRAVGRAAETAHHGGDARIDGGQVGRHGVGLRELTRARHDADEDLPRSSALSEAQLA